MASVVDRAMLRPRVQARPAGQECTFAHPSEAEFASLLTFYGISWQYEPTTFPLEWDAQGRVSLAFSPDFYLPEYDLYIELATRRPARLPEEGPWTGWPPGGWSPRPAAFSRCFGSSWDSIREWACQTVRFRHNPCQPVSLLRAAPASGLCACRASSHGKRRLAETMSRFPAARQGFAARRRPLQRERTSAESLHIIAKVAAGADHRPLRGSRVCAPFGFPRFPLE